ncbi:MAG TPA: hypothetical protein VNS88_02360, partial [Nitrospiraceae bacterium]|nr:hypothetical protein [Nitrospiraceae bacterium]
MTLVGATWGALEVHAASLLGSQRAAKLAARGAELEPAPQSLSIFCELVQKGFSTTFATKLLRVPPMPNETEL